MKTERGVKRSATTDKSAAARKKRAVQNEDSRRPVQKPRSAKRNPPMVDDDSNTDVSEDSEASLQVDNDIEDGADDDELEEAKAKDPEQQALAKESRQAQKALTKERKAHKPNATLMAQAKRLWSQVRQKNITSEERRKYIHELMELIRGKVQEVVFKHDASRIVQTLVKYGTQSERDEIATELKGKLRELAESKYSKFLVTKLVRHCPKHRMSILKEFQSQVIRLLLHREASQVIADSYELYANSHERHVLLRDFYGKEVALFAPEVSAAAAGSTEAASEKYGLRSIIKSANSEQAKRTLNSVKENLMLIFNNPEKSAVSHAIVHHILLEYLMEINQLHDEQEQERMRREIFETCEESLAEMVHTRDGSRAVREFIAQGTAKERKQIVKVLKPHVERMCTDDEAQLVLFTCFDMIDDTKMLSKSFLGDIVSKTPALWKSTQGRRALLYLLAPRSHRYFTPAQVQRLAETDKAKARTSKKDDGLRQSEIVAAVSPGLLIFLSQENLVGEMIADPAGSLLYLGIMMHTEGVKSTAIETLFKTIKTPYPSPEHLLDQAHTSRMLKVLLQGGHFSRDTNTVTQVPTLSSLSVASAWLTHVNRESTIALAMSTGGSFVVASLVERIASDGSSEEKTVMTNWFSDEVKDRIRSQDFKGKDTLLQSISTLYK